MQHHLHVQHHQHHHDPDNIVVGVNWGPPYLQLTVKIADHQVNDLQLLVYEAFEQTLSY